MIFNKDFVLVNVLFVLFENNIFGVDIIITL